MKENKLLTVFNGFYHYLTIKLPKTVILEGSFFIHECDICKKAFALRNVLDKQIYTSEKPHECEMCKKAISSNSCLAKHKQIHTGDKP